MKFKSHIILILAILFSWNKNLYSQTSSQGIYLSADDFSNNKISFQPIEGKKYKLHLNDFFNQASIKISIGDSTYQVQKDSMFAYRDKENNVYRLVGRSNYKMLNPTEQILLYSKTSLGGYKNLQTIITYYFSSNASSSIQSLTKWNLKNAFPMNTAFHELLDMMFTNDHELIMYDNFYNMYKVNRVLQFSEQLLTTIKNK